MYGSLFNKKEVLELLRENKLFLVVILSFISLSILFTYSLAPEYNRSYIGKLETAKWNQRLFRMTSEDFDFFQSLKKSFERGESVIFNLGSNFVFIHTLLAPIYFLHRSADTLFAIQVFFILSGAIPLFLLAKEKLESRKLAFIISISYFFLPLTQNLLITEFGPVLISIPLFIFLYYFWETHRPFCFIMTVLLLSLTKQVILPLLILFSIVNFVRDYRDGNPRSPYWYLIPFVLGVLFLMFYYLYLVYIDFQTNTIVNNLGFSLKDLFKIILTNPWRISTRIFTMDKLGYISDLFGSFLYVPLLSPRIIFVSSPKILQNLFYESSSIDLFSEENFVLLPFLSVSLVYGIRRIRKITLRYLKMDKKLSDKVLTAILIFSLVFGLVFSFGMDRESMLRGSSTSLNYIPQNLSCEPPSNQRDRLRTLMDIKNSIPVDSLVVSDKSVCVPFSSFSRYVNMDLAENHYNFDEDSGGRPDFIVLNEFLIECLKGRKIEDEGLAPLSHIEVGKYIEYRDYEVFIRKDGFLVLKLSEN